MLAVILLAIAAVSATVFIQASGTLWWLRHLRARAEKPTGARVLGLDILIRTALVLISLHVAQILVWAVIYHLVEPAGLESFSDAIYFSSTTFTTLGYGDVVIEDKWRLLTGIESLNGVLLIGWSTAISFAVIERLLKNV